MQACIEFVSRSVCGTGAVKVVQLSIRTTARQSNRPTLLHSVSVTGSRLQLLALPLSADMQNAHHSSQLQPMQTMTATLHVSAELASASSKVRSRKPRKTSLLPLCVTWHTAHHSKCCPAQCTSSHHNPAQLTSLHNTRQPAAATACIAKPPPTGAWRTALTCGTPHTQ